jgi:hypothetical protein
MAMLRRQIGPENTTRGGAATASASNDLLASDSDILLQLCNVQASVLWERKRAVQALCNGVVSALEASDLQAYSVDEPEP